MDKRKQNREDFWDYSAYGTGSTEPPRNNGTLVTVLLILVICLIGAVSALSWQNIQLFQQLNRQTQDENAPLTFLEEKAPEALESAPELATATVPREDADLGMVGEEISPFYQRYYRIPQGLYIAQITKNGIAGKLGLQPGDILLSINGKPVTTMASLKALLGSFARGATVELRVYRAGQEFTFRLILGENPFSHR